MSGVALAAPKKTRRLAGILCLLIGYGGVGVAWERTCGCDLRYLQRPPRIAARGVVTHAPFALAGHLLLRSMTSPVEAHRE